MGCQVDYTDEEISEEEIKQRRYAHLLKTMKESGWEEIKSSEYRRLKRDDDYQKTARIGTKFFKQVKITKICPLCEGKGKVEA